MKIAVPLVSAVLFCLAAAQSGLSAESKIAVMSMEKAFDAYHKTAKAQEQINARAKVVEAERKPLIETAKILQTELEEMSRELKDKSINAAAREQKQALAQEKYIELRQAEEKLETFNRVSQKELNAEIRETNRKLVAEIKTFVSAYAAGKGFSLVLDCSGSTLNDTEAVVWFDKTLDITGDIIAIINEDVEK